MPRIGDDRLRDLHLAEVVVQHRAVVIDRGGADHRIIDLELLDEINRRLADDAAVGAAHDAAGDDHFDRRIDAHAVGDVDVVGDHHQAAVVEQRLGDGFGRRTDVDEQRGVVGNQRRGGASDRLLLIGRDLSAGLVLDILDARRKQRSAVDSRQQALVAEVVQILADRLRGDVEMRGEVVDENAPL